MKQMVTLILACCAMFYPATVMANAGAIYLLNQHVNQQNRDNEVVAVPGDNDAFVIVRHYYRSGPEFRICDRSDVRGIVAMKDHCAKERRVVHGIFSWTGYHYEYDAIGKGLSPQAYLDNRFGEGVIKHAGVGYMRGALLLFYKVVLSSAGDN